MTDSMIAYRVAPCHWLFDDKRHDVEKEPFIGTASEFHSDVALFMKAPGDLRIVFSDERLDPQNVTLSAQSKRNVAQANGCDYLARFHPDPLLGFEAEVWLCPVLTLYFGDIAPEYIHAHISAA